MQAPVSIIIPTFNSGEDLPQTLMTLFDGVAEGLVGELIIADGGSEDATLAIAEDAGAELITGAKGRGAQLAAGAGAARGAWFLFLHADSRLSPNWCGAVRDHLSVADRAGYFKLRFDTPGAMARMTAGWANMRSRAFALPYGDQGLLISRLMYQRIGGFDPIPLMEDVAIAKKIGRNFTPLPATITTSAQRYQENGWMRQGAANLSRLLRYKLGTSPETLAKGYARDKASPN